MPRSLRLRRACASAALILAATVAACAGGAEDAPASALRVAVDTVAGVEHVRNAGAPPPWRVERVLRIGDGAEVDAAGPTSFGYVPAVVADAGGNVYVADGQALEVRVFDPAGRHLRTIGREGAGPGELRSLQSLAWLGDTLLALDFRNARIGRFDREGRWVGLWRHQPVSGPVIRFYRAGEDEAYVPAMAGGGLGLVRLGPSGAGDTIPFPNRVSAASPSGVRCDDPSNGALHFFDVPFAPPLAFALAPGGLTVRSVGSRYRLAVIDPSGDTLRIVEREHPPVPVGDAEWEEALRPYRQAREKSPGMKCDGSLERPAHKAAVRHVLRSHEGETWVEHVTADGFAWDVFDDAGRLLGSFAAPPRSANAPPYARGGRLYVIGKDEMDVPYVEVYRVEREGTGGA